ncbi:unnamed protein product [Cercopithifilaria johnstoni]|uniref:C2H2-type domain-containing protein n=1 Tax=Cercopithifilaria johnstoni TaxID=2874296 RepID=A0A8J2MSM7_9BILA|nr:unnamed protein product [Cercopithifilaria johnstoni]
MHLSYYLVVLVLPLYIAQVTVSNENDQPVQLGLRNDGKIRTIANGSKTNKKWFKYIECGKEFSCAGNLKRPKVMMHTEDDDAYKCKICSKVFNAPSILTRHNLVHEEKRPFKCNTCDKGFKYRYCLSAHMVTHTDEKTQKCNVCGKEFKHIRSLQRHKFTHGNVRFQCKECGRNFTQKIRNCGKRLDEIDNEENKAGMMDLNNI